MKKSTRIASYIAVFGLVFSSGLLTGNSLPTHSLSVNSGSNTGSILGATQDNQLKADLNLKTMGLVKNILQKKYIHVNDLNIEKLSQGAVKGMVSALDDPYSEFMTPEETQQFNESLNAELEGIGAELTVRDQLLLVISTIKDSPAQKAGLLSDDVIVKINEEIVADMTLYEAVKKIQGKKGTEVKLTLLRKDQKAPLELKIIRDTIAVESVRSKEVEKGIWHVEINQFSDDTRMEFNRIINEIKLKNPKGIILDLRFNGGGYLEGAVDILSAFIRGEKEVVSIEYREAKNNEKLKTSGNAQFPDLPLIVLINKGSASASEIVAAAIQDLKRGLLMGETSYGKGTVQEVDPLPDGSSLRFTIAKWITPSGRSINKVGLTPDREVVPQKEDYEKKFDRQLDEAVKYLRTL
jgi:carboxyl-terminal processing protease